MKAKPEPGAGRTPAAGRDGQARSGEVSRILVAGVGNTFMGDDAFGAEVTRRLHRRELPSQVHAIDFGIRGFDLASALHDNYDAVILINAVRRQEKPGTLFVIEPNLEELKQAQSQELLPESHGVNDKVLDLLRQIEADAFKQLIVVACEPATTDPRAAGLSAPVESAVDEAVEIVECLVAGMLGHPLC